MASCDNSCLMVATYYGTPSIAEIIDNIHFNCNSGVVIGYHTSDTSHVKLIENFFLGIIYARKFTGACTTVCESQCIVMPLAIGGTMAHSGRSVLDSAIPEPKLPTDDLSQECAMVVGTPQSLSRNRHGTGVINGSLLHYGTIDNFDFI